MRLAYLTETKALADTCTKLMKREKEVSGGNLGEEGGRSGGGGCIGISDIQLNPGLFNYNTCICTTNACFKTDKWT